ncbi:MAG: hypothetical protein K2X08_00615, partial [Chlamydiales bacterium]|nr:hypothetical protein [Chlamydiales bacterium]
QNLHHAGSLEINRENFSKDPKKLLLDFYQAVKELRAFPRIQFKGEAGVDAGGLTREFVAKLFEALGTSPEKFGLFAEQTLEGSLVLKFDDQMTIELRNCCIAIGMVFAFALKNHQSIRTGQQFNKNLFHMLHVLDNDDIAFIVEKGQNLLDQNSNNYKLLLNKFYKKMHADLFAPLGASDEEVSAAISMFVDEGKIPACMNDIFAWSEDMTYSEKKEEIDDRMINHATLHATILVVMGMFNEGGIKASSWKEVKGESPTELKLKIEGFVVSKEGVLNALKINQKDSETETWLRQWVNEASEEELTRFVQFITGSTVLAPDTKLRVHLYTADSEEIKWKLPNTHTCNTTIDIPNNYSDYKTFKEILTGSLRSVEHGFQAI